ncbi:hypothetical protein OB236_32315 [Paenibacillus sp. WQ 127069]|uniref:Uncharacterized protein n=1 Tax=Paenibacillus baimaensis TaxID=2982185 RepID=A0ABT2UQ78_9BACL|nr:hypothetical protein [Paenibacillus sp. WQ 127069]MCU6796820.1 hypothetical protein [Paenibacillus sp. WQ 127069]
MADPLTKHNKKRGNGLPLDLLNSLRYRLKLPGIEEREGKSGYSYFPDGYKKGRILKLSIDLEKIFIEFNSIYFENIVEQDIWNLTDMDRTHLHAAGVSCCYVGENLEVACEFVDEAIRLHPILNNKNKKD